MKTKTFLLISLMLGIGLLNLNGQVVFRVNDKGTGTVHTSFVWPWTNPVYCDGVLIDELTGTVSSKNVYSLENWEQNGANEHYYGELVSSNTGEVFRFNERDHAMNVVMIEGEIYGTDHVHFTMLGNRGTRYVGSCIIDLHSWTVTYTKFLCN